MSTSTEEYHKVQDLVAKWREKHQAEEEKIAKLLAELEMLHVKVKAEKAVSKHLEKRVQSLSSEYEMGVRENESLILQAETLMRKVSMHAKENSDLRETIATLQKQAHNNQDTASPRVNGKQSLEEKRQSPSADVMQLGRQNEPEAKSNSGSSDVEKVHETSPSFSSSSFSSTSSSTSSSSSPPPLHSNGGNTRPIPVMAMKRNQLRSGSSLSLNSLTRDERNERNKAVGDGHMVVTDRSVSTPHHLDHQQENGDYAKQSHTSGDVGAGSVPSTTRRRGSLRSILKSIDSSSYLLDESDSPQVPSHDGTSRKHSKSYSVDSPVSASSVPTPTLQNRDEENEEAGGDGDRNVGRITRASSLGDTRYLANSGKRVSFGKSQTKEFSADLTVLRGPMMEKCSVVTVSLDLVQKWILTEMDKDGKSTPRGQVPEPVPLSRSSSSSSNSSLSSASMRKVILPPSEVMDIQYNQATKTFSYHNDGVKQQDNRSATHFGNIAEMACPHGVNVIGITDAASRFPLRSVEEHTFMVKDQRKLFVVYFCMEWPPVLFFASLPPLLFFLFFLMLLFLFSLLTSLSGKPSKPVTVYGMCRTVYKEVRFKVAPYSYFRCSLPVTFCILSKQSFFDLHFDLLEQISSTCCFIFIYLFFLSLLLLLLTLGFLLSSTYCGLLSHTQFLSLLWYNRLILCGGYLKPDKSGVLSFVPRSVPSNSRIGSVVRYPPCRSNCFSHPKRRRDETSQFRKNFHLLQSSVCSSHVSNA